MSTREKVQALYLDGVKGGEIARRLNVSRQVVSYHLSDKSKRRRANMTAEQRERVNALARERYGKAKP